MCLSTSTPTISTPAATQDVKQPETTVLADKAKMNRTNGAVGGGTLLTGPSGVASVTTGKTSLLGG